MKTIDTLIEDVYGLFNTGHEVSDEDAEAFGTELAGIIQDRLKQYTKKRKPYLRLSNIGKNPKSLWYELNGYEGEGLEPHTKIKFLYGDLIESMLLFLVKQAGHTVTDEQKEISIEGVLGHADCTIDGITVDVKSVSPYSFKKFENGTVHESDPFGYIAQISAYTQGNEDPTVSTERAAFLAMDKSLGKLTLMDVYDDEMIDAKEKIKEMKELVASGTPPEGYDDFVTEDNGNVRLGISPSYDSQKFNMYPELRIFLYSTGPKFYVHIEKEPRVVEIDKDGNKIEKE